MCVVRRSLKSSSQGLLGQSLLNLVCSICRVRRLEIINFMRGDNFGGKKCKIDVFHKKKILLYSGAWFSRSNCIVMLTKAMFTKVVDFMTPGQGRGHISHIVKMHYFLKNHFLSSRHISDKLSI